MRVKGMTDDTLTWRCSLRSEVGENLTSLFNEYQETVVNMKTSVFNSCILTFGFKFFT